MNQSNECPCGSGNMYVHCCEPYHLGKVAPSAATLMRSRYTAYVLCLPQYLIQTTHPSKRRGLTIGEIEDWSKENEWKALEIIKSSKNRVEFKAYYTSKKDSIEYVHHELSNFLWEKEKWYYVSGSFY